MVYDRGEIAAEYDASALATEEFEKVKWGSQAGMLNRFRLVLDKLSFDHGKRWLDVGCGTGGLQALVCGTHADVIATGIDISPKLLAFAASRTDTRHVDFLCQDMMDLCGMSFDLVTCIGVLQKTSFTPREFFVRVEQLLTAGGQVFVDTKNIEWARFREPGFTPEPSHEWFRPIDLTEAATAAGLGVAEVGGFLPREGRIVAPAESHTIFLVAEK